MRKFRRIYHCSVCNSVLELSEGRDPVFNEPNRKKLIAEGSFSPGMSDRNYCRKCGILYKTTEHGLSEVARDSSKLNPEVDE